MSTLTRGSEGDKVVRRNKRCNPNIDGGDEDAVRCRPTASERARKAKKVPTTTSNLDDYPFQPPFVEPNNEEEENLESFERELQSNGGNPSRECTSPTQGLPREPIDGYRLRTCSQRVRSGKGKGIISLMEEGQDEDSNNDEEVEDDDTFVPEQEEEEGDDQDRDDDT